jgi:tripartite-type tricarboxylate transporter receptor subunit TctC
MPDLLKNSCAHAVALVILTGFAFTASLARAQGQFPVKPVRLVIPYPPGGGTDTIGRPLAQRLSDAFGQPVVVDNRGGGGGFVGMEYVAKAPPDGHTIVIALTAQLAVNVSLFKKLPYDPVKDYAPITLLANGPYVLVVHPSLPARTVKELVALARKRPSEITYASSGNGSGGHLASEMLNSMTGMRMIHIPHKGGGPALIDLIAGQAQVLFSTWASGRGHIQSGRMRALGVSTAKRPAAMPDIPTIAEAGVPGFDAGVWYALLAPANTPREVVQRLNREASAVLKQAEYRKLLFDSAIDPVGGSPEELGAYIRSEITKWAKVVRDANVRVD